MSFLTKMARNVSRFNYRSQIPATSCTHLLQKSSRDLCSTSTLCIKMFMEYENKYAYNILRNKGFAVDIETTMDCASPNKHDFKRILEQDWSKKSPAEIFEIFPKFAVYCKENKMCISNSIFDDYIDNLTESLSKATDEQLVSLFYGLNQWPETQSIRTRNYIEVWVALDDTCRSRLNNWSPDEMLLFISLFFMLNVNRVSESSRKILDKLADKAKKLTPEQLVRTFFFVGVQRKPPYSMHNLEVQIENNFSLFSVDDLAIISMGFFKSKTPIRSNQLVIKMLEVVIDNCKIIHEVSLAAVLKVARYSLRGAVEKDLSMIYKLLDALQNEIPRLSFMCNVHLALLGTSKLVLHEGCLNSIANNVINKLSQTRLKDLERLVLSYGTFRYLPQMDKNLLDAIMDELRKPEREQEIRDHGRSFACCIQYFGLMGLYPIDLIKKILCPDFLRDTYGKHVYLYGKEILTINNSTQIFCKEQNLNFLGEKEVIVLSKKYTDYVPTKEFKKQYNLAEKMFIDIVDILSEMRGGTEFVAGDHILTHHQRGDVILCNSPDGTPVPIVNKFAPKTFGSIRRPPDDKIWIVLVIAGKNAIIKGKGMATGPFCVKIEELRQLGYHANLILWNIYTGLDTFEKKEEYLRKCINGAIKGH